MKYQFDGYNWLVTLEKGELLKASLTELVRQEQIKGAWLSGVGACLSAEIGFYDLNIHQYEFKTFDQILEIISLQGNIAWEGDEPVIHIHASLSDQNMQAYGGHVKELKVAGTCEILVHRWYKGELKRRLDNDTGLKLLEL